MCKLWLISEAISNPLVCVKGFKPVAKPSSYSIKDLLSTWSSFLSRPQPVSPPLTIVVTWMYAFPSNVSWVIYEAFLPFIGGVLFSVFMLLFMKKVLHDKPRNENLFLLAAFTSGFTYETILLSPWVGIYFKGFRALLPLTLIFLMLTFSKLNDVRSLIAFSMLTGLLLTSLYDIRMILASIVLIFVFTVIYYVLSNSMKISEIYSFNKRLVFALMIIAIVVLILSVVPTMMLISLKASNPFGGIRTLTLSVIVGDYDFVSVLGLPFPLLENMKIAHAISMLLIAFVLGYVLFAKQSRELRQVTLILILVLLVNASIIYNSSPLKVIQQSLVKVTILDINVGVLFRTPKFFVTISYVLLSMLVGLSTYIIASDLKQRRRLKGIIFMALLLSSIVSLAFINVYANNSDISPRWQKASPLPRYYYDVYTVLNDKIDDTLFRILWLPRTGKYSAEKPVWLEGINWGVGEKAFPLRTYFYYDTPMEYIYPFILRLGVEGKTKALSGILTYLGVKYIVVVTDYWNVEQRELAFSIISNLNQSQYFKEVHNNGKLFVFENLQAKKALRLVSTPIIVEGGLQTLADAIEEGLNISNVLTVFADQILPPDIVENSKIIIAHSMSNLEIDFLVQLLYWKKINNATNALIVIPSKYALGIEPDKWHPYYLANPHHAEWEIFYTWSLERKGRYDLDFRHDWGFVGATKEGQKLDIPIKITETGNYIVAIRYLESVQGGEFIVRSNGFPIARVKTLNSSNSLQWFLTKVYMSKGDHILTLENKRGRNAVNIVLLIPENEYEQRMELVRALLHDKTVVLTNNNKSGQKWPHIGSLDEHIIRYRVDGGSYIIHVNASGINFPAYLVIPEQWYPDWSASFNNTMFKDSLSFPSIFITAFEISPEKHNAGIKYLQIKVYSVSNETWRIIFNYEVIACLIIISTVLTLVARRREIYTLF